MKGVSAFSHVSTLESLKRPVFRNHSFCSGATEAAVSFSETGRTQLTVSGESGSHGMNAPELVGEVSAPQQEFVIIRFLNMEGDIAWEKGSVTAYATVR